MSRQTLETRELAACIRHDLRDPLGAMSHWLHLLEGEQIDATLRGRACQGLRAAIGEQLRQIERLAQVLEMAQVLPAPPLAPEQRGSTRVSARKLVGAVLASLSAEQFARVESEDLGTWEISAQPQALEDALTSLLLHGLRQLLEGERLRLYCKPDVQASRMHLCLQVLSGSAGPIDQPWRLLVEPLPVPSLTALNVRSVLSQHQAGLRITRLPQGGDTLEIDFPVGTGDSRNSP